MEILPIDIILLIFNQLSISDKRKLLITCNNYYKLKNIVMKDVIYHVYLIYYDQGPSFASIGIFNNLIDCRKYVIQYIDKIKNHKKIIKKKKRGFVPIYKKLNQHNYYTMFSTRDEMRDMYDNYHGSHGFLIEEEYINHYNVDEKLGKL